jgi:hypothetical protein
MRTNTATLVSSALLMTLYIIMTLLHSTGSGTQCCYDGEYINNKTCKSCEDHAVCSLIGSTISTLQLKPGYWRASNGTTDIRKCWVAEACLGTNTTSTTTNTTITTTRRTTDTATIGQIEDNGMSNIYCSDGYKGPCKYSQIYLSCVFMRVLR